MIDDREIIPLAEVTKHRLDALIERWWTDHFPGSAVAFQTAAWNVAHAAKEALKERLIQVLAPSEAPPGDDHSQGSM